MTTNSVAPSINSVVQTVRPSATLAMNEKSAQLLREGRTVYRLGFGQSPFPIPSSVVAALQANAFQKDYLPTRGLPALRAAVAAFHQRFHGLPATAEDILIGPGSKELLFLAQMSYQAELLLPAPSWVSYAPQARLLGLNVRWLPTRKEDGWRLLSDELERACLAETTQPRLLILNYPNNPTGTSFTASQLESLARIARQYGVLIVADEIYGELHHTGQHVSIARFYPEGTIVSSGLSKWCGAGGWRLGTFCFPKDLRWMLDAMACIASETFSAVAAPIQYAAVTAFQRNEAIEHYLQQTRRIMRALGNQVSERLNALGVETPAPDGGFYLFPDFTRYAATLHAHGLMTSAEFCERLLQDTGVALLPGSDFGRPTNEFTCRLAYVDFDGEACLAAVQQISSEQNLDEAFLHKHCDKVLTAIELIGNWLKDA